MLNPKITL